MRKLLLEREPTGELARPALNAELGIRELLAPETLDGSEACYAGTRMSERTATNATVADVARRAGVSKMTVSRVINGGNGVRPETRRRVERAVAELDFVPNGVARGLMTARTKTLGLIVPDIVNPFFTMVVHGAETVARRAGYHLLLCNSEGDLAQERQYIEHMISHRVDGILIAPTGDRSKANLGLLARRKLPFVLIDRSVAGMKCDLVQSDGVEGARKLIGHLISLGHKRIAAIIEQDDVSTARERLLGYREALGAAKLKVSPELVIRVAADRAGGYSAMQQILSLKSPPTAVFAVNNMTALGAMQALRERGLSVPKDIALVCFDDVEHLAVLSPFMTVVNQPTEMFGALSAQLLVDRLASQDGGPRRCIVLPSDLIVRESCGAKAGWPQAPGARKSNPTSGTP